jgi:aldehyde:ferredoxin oxidoreductase
MTELAEINWETVDLKEKYWRMDATLGGNASELLEETMEDYEALSEESCMYCNRHCKQYWTHESSRLIHLCLPCLIGDKITILLEKIITRWRKRHDQSGWYDSYTSA